MIAASVWSLLIPSMEMAEANGQNSALILGGGFIIGALFLLFLDHVIPHQHLNEDKPEGPKSMLGNLLLEQQLKNKGLQMVLFLILIVISLLKQLTMQIWKCLI